MTKISHEIKAAISELKENKIVILPTKQGFQLATLAGYQSNIKSLQKIKNSSLPVKPIYFFSSLAQIQSHCKNIPKYVPILIHALTPGPVAFILPSNKSLGEADTIACTIPSQPEILRILNDTGQPLTTTSANPAGSPVATSLSMVRNYFENKVDMILDLETLRCTLPDLTIIDCTKQDIVKIIRPGVIKTSEIKSILPKHVRVEKSYKFQDTQKLSLNFPIIKQNDIIKIDTNISLIIGTKEKLNQTFSLKNSEYFTLKQYENFILLNIGSQAHPETIAKNLYKNLSYIQNLTLSKGFLLWQNWGNGHWGDIIEYTLSKFVVDNLQPERQSLQTFQL